MTRTTVFLARCLLVMTPLVAPLSAADDETLMKDLTAVIALHALPCGQVVAVMVRAENDYNASCKDGNRYRVYINSAERVVVEALKS